MFTVVARGGSVEQYLPQRLHVGLERALLRRCQALRQARGHVELVPVVVRAKPGPPKRNGLNRVARRGSDRRPAGQTRRWRLRTRSDGADSEAWRDARLYGRRDACRYGRQGQHRIRGAAIGNERQGIHGLLARGSAERRRGRSLSDSFYAGNRMQSPHKAREGIGPFEWVGVAQLCEQQRINRFLFPVAAEAEGFEKETVAAVVTRSQH